MRVSEQLQDFLTAFCGVDEDLAETAAIVRDPNSASLREWMLPELDAAIRGELITLPDAEYLMSRRFESPADIARWLGDLRQEWSR